MSRRTVRRLGLLLVVACAVGGTGAMVSPPAIDDFLGSGSPAAESDVPGRWDGPRPVRRQVLAALDQVRVVADRPEEPGYDRECGTDAGCVFGPDWSDETDAAMGHDDCDTRNNVLAEQLVDVTYREGTHECVVLSGVLADPYTGERIEFSKERATEVGIDHIYPLARAWDMGAADWPLSKRMRFANDPVHNLIAVSGSANSSKGDRGPGEWMPINRGYACTYAARYLEAANTYELPITENDQAALQSAARTCPAIKAGAPESADGERGP